MRANRRHGGVPPSRSYNPMAKGAWDSTTNDL
jgi:hypothetical protein